MGYPIPSFGKASIQTNKQGFVSTGMGFGCFHLCQMSLLNLRFLYFSNSTSTSKLNQGLYLTSDMTFKLLGYIPYGLGQFFRWRPITGEFITQKV